MEIVSATSDFDFKSASLADPQPLTGQAGFYFTQLSVGQENKSLCLQLPECVTKQGIVNVKNAKYLDLMFERDKHDELMRWVEKLEYTCQDIIDSKKDLWFQSELTRDDIETMMTQITRLYQSGKYVLMRVFIDVNKSGQKCIAYDENEIGFDLDILEANKSIIPLVMIEGVKFSSRSFEISLKLVQVMVMGKYEKKSSCLIKRPDVVKSVLDNTPRDINRPSQVNIIKKPIQAAQAAQPVITKMAPVVEKTAPTVVQKAPTVVETPPSSVVIKKTPVMVQKAQIITHTPKVQEQLIKLEAPNKPITMLRENPTDPLQKISVGEKTLKPIIKNIVNKPPINLVKKNDIEEVNIKYEDLSDSISLKNPNEVYYEIYKNAREKAKLCRTKAIEAYLEAKEIKTRYMLHDLDDSEDDDSDNDENYDVDFE
jgi:hypothetical protein